MPQNNQHVPLAARQNGHVNQIDVQLVCYWRLTHQTDQYLSVPFSSAAILDDQSVCGRGERLALALARENINSYMEGPSRARVEVDIFELQRDSQYETTDTSKCSPFHSLSPLPPAPETQTQNFRLSVVKSWPLKNCTQNMLIRNEYEMDHNAKKKGSLNRSSNVLALCEFYCFIFCSAIANYTLELPHFE